MTTPITTAAFAQQLTVILKQLDADRISIDQAVAQLTTLFNDWTVGAITPTQLAINLSTVLANWNNFVSAQLEWLTTPVDGGPHGDGTVDIPDYLGNVTTIPGWAKVQADIGDFAVRYDVATQGLTGAQRLNVLKNLGITPSLPAAYDDASAALAGVVIGDLYLNGSVLQMRLS